MTCRSTTKSTSPTMIRSAPIAEVITIGIPPPVRKIGMLVRAASSIRLDCTAHHREGRLWGRGLFGLPGAVLRSPRVSPTVAAGGVLGGLDCKITPDGVSDEGRRRSLCPAHTEGLPGSR